MKKTLQKNKIILKSTKNNFLFFGDGKIPRTTITKQSLEPVVLRSRLKRENLEYFSKIRTFFPRTNVIITKNSSSYIRTFHCWQPWTEAESSETESSEAESSEAESSEAENGPKMCQLAGLVQTGILQSKVFYRVSHLTAKLTFVYFFELKFFCRSSVNSQRVQSRVNLRPAKAVPVLIRCSPRRIFVFTFVHICPESVCLRQRCFLLTIF
jgi:hypothetical protein